MQNKFIDEKFMREALEEAHLALSSGEIPVGCVIVINDEIVGRGHNCCESLADPTAHAEIIAIRDACTKSGDCRLDGATAYVTLEPCPMCTSALILARVKRIVYGAQNTELGACGSVFNFIHEPAFNHHPLVKGKVLEDESHELLERFFKQKRKQNPLD